MYYDQSSLDRRAYEAELAPAAPNTALGMVDTWNVVILKLESTDNNFWKGRVSVLPGVGLLDRPCPRISPGSKGLYRFRKENLTCVQLDSYLAMHLKFTDRL